MIGEEYSVIFLVNNFPADKIMLLKRAKTKRFAPNYYTGIGGKIGDAPDIKDETALDGAYRELTEETDGELNSQNILLHEFARCVFDNGVKLYYYLGQYSKEKLPNLNPSDGVLVWVETEDIIKKEIIPTTRVICDEWANRLFTNDNPFTVFVKEMGVDNTVRLVDVRKVEDGLF